MQDDATCPRCQDPVEDTKHVTCCQAQGANEVWQGSIERLQKHLASMDTAPDLVSALLGGLNAWRDNKDIIPQVYTDGIQLALQHQNNIGWQQLLEGMMASTWTRLQAQHCENTRSKKTSKSWAAGLIKQLVKTGQLQWKHRNDYKHVLGKPRHKKHIFRVNQEML